MKKYLLKFSVFVLVISCLNLLPVWSFLQEILRNFSHYLLVIHFVLLLSLLIFFKIRCIARHLILNFSFVVLYIIPISEFYLVGNRLPGQALAKVKILYANVFTANTDYSKLKDLISSKQPDLIALIETNTKWLEALNLKSEFPYFFEIPREDNFGLALYSKHQFDNAPLTDLGEGLPPVALVPIQLPGLGGGFNFALIHSLPPVSQSAFINDKLLLRRVASNLRFSNIPLLIAGDFNSTPYGWPYGKFKEWLSLEHAFAGQGLFKTWNAKVPFMNFMIDHLFVRGSVRVVSAERMDQIGSDHFPLYAEIEFVAEGVTEEGSAE